MAKTLQRDFTVGGMVARLFQGNSIYWGHGDDVDHSANAANYSTPSSDMIVDRTIGTGSNRSQMGRLLFRFDLSALPPNAVITNATFSVYFKFFGFRNPQTVMPITFGVYRVLPAPGMTTATMQYYVPSSGAWSRFGMVDGVDYKAAEEATAVVTQSEIGIANDTGVYPAPTASVTLLKTFNLTNLAKFAAATDSRLMHAMLSRSNAHRRSFTILGGHSIPDIGGTETGSITLHNTVALQPKLVITYTDALTFHPADDDGTIDETVEIDTTLANRHYFDPVRVGGETQAKKFFVKNQLASSAPNLRVFSQLSHASRIYELERTSVGDGTISDIGTVDQSNDNVNYTRQERVRVVFTDATTFTVEHDNGTLDDPTVADAWAACTPTGGTVGALYTETALGFSFTITAGATAFEAGDEIIFRTYLDDAEASSPADSDDYLHIAPDSSNAPGVFQPLKWKPAVVSGIVSNDTVVGVTDVSLFSVGQAVNFYRRTDGALLFARTVGAVGASTITVDGGNVTLAQGDYAEPVRVGTSSLAGGDAFPFWLKAVAPTGATRETKYPRWRAEAD